MRGNVRVVVSINKAIKGEQIVGTLAGRGDTKEHRKVFLYALVILHVREVIVYLMTQRCKDVSVCFLDVNIQMEIHAFVSLLTSAIVA